jgi:hypothetical protein
MQSPVNSIFMGFLFLGTMQKYPPECKAKGAYSVDFFLLVYLHRRRIYFAGMMIVAFHNFDYSLLSDMNLTAQASQTHV